MDEKELEIQIAKANKKVEQLLSIMEAQQEMIARNDAAIKKQEQQIARYKRELNNFSRNIRYELHDDKKFVERYQYPKIMEQSLTMKQLVEGRRSYVRFTEAILDMLMQFMDQEILEPEDEEERQAINLRNRLYAILREDNEKCDVAIPDFFGSLDQFQDSARKRFRDYLIEERRLDLMRLLPRHKNFHDALLVHPDDFDSVRSGMKTRERFDMLATIWNGKTVIAVSVPGKGLTKDNPYFESASDFITVDVPLTNAMSSYDRIFEECIKYQSYQSVYLIAAGPVGVVLASDICKAGSQAIDVGSLGNRYLEFHKKTGGK